MPRPTTAVVAAFLALLVACQIEEAAPPDDPKEPAPEPPAVSALIYVERTTLKSHDVATGDEVKLTELPSADVAVSPDGARFVAVKEASPQGEGPEGFRNPVLEIGSTEGGEAKELGPGRGPVWSPDGGRIATIAAPPNSYLCGKDAEISRNAPGKGCRRAEFLYTYDANSRRPAPRGVGSGPAARWSLFGWTRGDNLLISSGQGAAIVPVGDAENSEGLGFGPSEIWGASPVDNLLLIVEGRGARLVMPGEGEGPAVDLGGALPGDGTWSPEDSHIAVALVTRQGIRAETTLALIDTATGEVNEVPDSDGAQGPVAWLEDGSAFAFSRVSPEDPRRLEAVLCSIDLTCEPLFDYREGVALLALR
jgi:hypothetical protein